MKSLFGRFSVGMAAMFLWLLPGLTHAEDIDVFVGGTGGSGGKPNILIVLDNTANWSRQAQQWPGGITQGQSEVRAIKAALAGLVDKVNIGLMEFTTEGNANQNGGFVRFDLQALTTNSQTAFSTELDEIFNNIESPTEKRSGSSWGNLMYDVYNYLTGSQQSISRLSGNTENGTPESAADVAAYTAQYSQFSSPLDAEDSCVKTYVIFIGNPSQSGPDTDTSENSSALASLYSGLRLEGVAEDKLAGQSSGTPLPIPLFTTTTTNSFEDIGWTAGRCYASDSACTTAEAAEGGLCAGRDACSCSSANNDKRKASCSGNNREFFVRVDNSTTDVTATGQYNTTAGVNWNLDDWAKFLFQHGVPIIADVEQTVDGVTTTTPVTVRMPVVTYTIDVFNAQQNADHTGLMMSTATVGGGKYFAARNEDAIVDAINEATSEILSASSTFAAVALPLSESNRAQNENQVFIGMFRPNADATPRWFGNLKRYQVGIVNGKAELVDVDFAPAINTLTNFPSECAKSFWTSDSGTYWEDKNISPPPLSQCVGATTSPWSDAPDGPFVEKGGAAQALRDYPSVADPDIAVRNVLTAGATLSGLTAFNSSFAASVTGGQSVLDYIRGHDRNFAGETLDQARPTIHGDVVHSRPLPLNYGTQEGESTPDVSVFYGTNDGLLRAIDAATGKERWSFVAPEHFGKLQRLSVNEPLVAFPNQDPEDNPTPKDYFFDGAIGSHLEYDEDNRISTAYIFPSMRRGGRMVYGFNVTDPDSPTLLWHKGCPQLESDTGCDTGFEGIGQTWSLPVSAKIKAHDDGETPVVIFGGGYDNCEDGDAAATTCTSDAKGRAIYVLDAEDGTLVAAIPTAGGSVAADISLVDIDYDGYTDYAYAVDLSGNVWRVNFVNPALTTEVIESDDWEATKIAYTSGGSRKFMHAPSVMPYNGKVYMAFGSGNRERPLETNYPYAQNIDDRFYVFLDDPLATEAPYDLDDSSIMHDFTDPTDCEEIGVLAGAAQRGWFMSLPSRGEQVATPSVMIGGMVAFNTYRPGGSSVGMCSRPMGVSTAYLVNLFNASGAIGSEANCGGKRSVEVGTGMPIAPTVGTVEVKTDGNCTGENCDSEVITFCIGCEGGLSTTVFGLNVDQTRKRTYWNSDVDR